MKDYIFTRPFLTQTEHRRKFFYFLLQPQPQGFQDSIIFRIKSPQKVTFIIFMDDDFDEGGVAKVIIGGSVYTNWLDYPANAEG